VARLTDPAWTASRRVAGIWGNRPRTLSPQAATAGMVRAVVGTLSFSAVSVSFSVGVPRKGRHSPESDCETRQKRTGWLLPHGASPVCMFTEV
jgi:hypothetical protein